MAGWVGHKLVEGVKDISLELDALRGLSICGIIIENWLLFIPHQGPTAALYGAVGIVQSVAGTMVHLFLILSGYGLTLSCFRSQSSLWLAWAKKRFVRVVFPYLVIVTSTFVLVDMLHGLSPHLFATSYPWATLLAYLAFLRNFHGLGSSFNPTLWFMPVIVGLYLLFPLLLWVLRKKGVLFLLVFSAGLTYLSITFCLLIEYPVTHDTALPFFFVIEFALGMALGFVASREKDRLLNLMTFKMFWVGMIFYIFSWALRAFWAFGNAYNDFLTATGVLLLTLYPSHLLLRICGKRVLSGLSRLSKQSYLMYLLHGTLILFVVKPLLGKAGMLPLDSIVSLGFSLIYCVLMFLLASLTSKPLGYLSDFLFPAGSRKSITEPAS